MTGSGDNSSEGAGDADQIRVAIIDDHPLIRDALARVLDAEADIEVVATGGSAREATQIATVHSPDLVVLDLNLPDDDGVGTCERLISIRPDVRVLVFTGYADATALREARRAGASGFLSKTVETAAITHAIRENARGSEVLPPRADPRQIDDDPLLSRLTPRELEVLDLVAQGKTNRAIAQELSLAETTIKNYVSAILVKLGIGHRAGAAAYYVGGSPASRPRWRRQRPEDPNPRP